MVGALAELGHETLLVARTVVDARGRFGEPVPVPLITGSSHPWPRGLRGLGHRLELRQLQRRVRSIPIDLVWERASHRCSAGLRWARQRGAVHLLELNAPMALEHRSDPDERAVIARTDRVITVSPWLQRYATRLGARDARCVPNGSELIALDHRAARKDLGWTGRVLVHHGSLSDWHGLAGFLPILDALDATLVVIGTGSVPHHPRLVHLPFANRPELARLLSAADVAIAPVPDHAPPWLDPLKIHDYRAIGIPVIGSPHPATALADRRIPLQQIDAWVEAVSALSEQPRIPSPRPWTRVCAEALRGMVPA